MSRVCPFCGAAVEDLPPDLPGDTQECPVCGQILDRPVPPPEQPAAPYQPDAPAVAPAEAPAPPPLPVQPPPAEDADVLASLRGRLKEQSRLSERIRLSELDELDEYALADPPIPWEDDRGFFSSLFATIGWVLFKPRQAFTVPGKPGLVWPLAYAIILGTISMGGNLVVESMLGKSGLPTTTLAWVIAFMPLIAVASQFLSAGIHHLCLMIVGGNKKGFQTTFRVAAYSTTAGLWMLIPGIGFYLSIVWDLVIGVVGLSMSHGITRGRAFWAWALPYLLILLVIVVVAFLVAGRVIGGMNEYQELLRQFQ